MEAYCGKCGAKCDLMPRFVRYDTNDGDRIYHLLVRCPNKRWCLDGHLKSWQMDLWYDGGLTKREYKEERLSKMGVEVK
jgi:hypothetical protein